jgi:hypothetical protein
MGAVCCGDDGRGRRKIGTVAKKKENGGDRGSSMRGIRQHGKARTMDSGHGDRSKLDDAQRGGGARTRRVSPELAGTRWRRSH